MELPAGMLDDDNGDFAGTAVREVCLSRAHTEIYASRMHTSLKKSRTVFIPCYQIILVLCDQISTPQVFNLISKRSLIVTNFILVKKMNLIYV